MICFGTRNTPRFFEGGTVPVSVSAKTHRGSYGIEHADHLVIADYWPDAGVVEHSALEI